MSGNDAYDPGRYWDRRLANDFDLRGAGHRMLGVRYNRRLYAARLAALHRGLGRLGASLRGKDVIEAGCGTGFYAEHLSRQGVSSYVGVDISATSVARLEREHPEFRFVLQDITESRKETIGTCDLALAADVLFHIVNDAAFDRGMACLTDWVRPGGMLVASDVFPAMTSQVAPHVRFRSLDSYRRHLRGPLWEVVLVEPIFGLLHPLEPVQGLSPLWRAASYAWRAAARFIGRRPIDVLVATCLGVLDDLGARDLAGPSAPAPKWLFARKSHDSKPG